MSHRTTAKPRRLRRSLPPRQVADFLRLFAATGSVAFAAKRAGIPRTTLYRERQRDSAFARRWEEARRLGVDRLNDEAFKRAIKGTKRPVFQGGQKVGDVRVYDNRLLLALLKVHHPETYGPKAPRRDGVPVDLARRLAAADERVARYEATLLARVKEEDRGR